MLKKTIGLFIIVFIYSAINNITNAQAIRRLGLLQKDKEVQDGYVLMSPMNYTQTYLFDKCGLKINEWSSKYRTATTAHIDENGNMWRAGQVNSSFFFAGGKTGIIEKFDWAGNLVWKFEYANEKYCLHHDFKLLRNGNIVVIAWERIKNEDARPKGKKEVDLTDSLWSEKIMEVKPIGTDNYEIVWEWRAWEHLIQDYDKNAENYGDVQANPQLLDVNYVGKNVSKNDWLHINSVDYNEELDQIIVSVLNFDEIWIIDHSTTKEEVKGHTGGKFGKGGDILYRWGNPNAYRKGDETDKKFYGQHDARWVKLNNEPYFSIFNNGQRRPLGNYSTVELIKLPIEGNSYKNENGVYLPKSQEWVYKDPVQPVRFYATNLSGAILVGDSNFIVTNGPFGQILEITKSGRTIWKYNNPVGSNGPAEQGKVAAGPLLFKVSYYQPGYKGFQNRNMASKEPIELNPDAICGVKGIDEDKENKQDIRISVYKNTVEIKDLNNRIEQINMYDLLGKNIYKENRVKENEIVKIENLKSGGYILEFLEKDNKTITRKILIE